MILFTLLATVYASLAVDLMDASKSASSINHNMGRWSPQIDSMSVLRWQTDYLPFSTALHSVNEVLYGSSLVDLHNNHRRVGAMCAQITQVLNQLADRATSIEALGLGDFMAYDVRDIAVECKDVTQKVRERNPDGDLSSTLNEMASAFTRVLSKYKVTGIQFTEQRAGLLPQRLWG